MILSVSRNISIYQFAGPLLREEKKKKENNGKNDLRPTSATDIFPSLAEPSTLVRFVSDDDTTTFTSDSC